MPPFPEQYQETDDELQIVVFRALFAETLNNSGMLFCIWQSAVFDGGLSGRSRQLSAMFMQ
jgi:hypothetical protein